MAEIILVKNNPDLDQMLQTRWYKSIGSIKNDILIEDYNGIKVRCSIDENNQLKYIYDYFQYDPYVFVQNMQEKYNVYWIDEADLLEYNQFSVLETISFDEFKRRILLLRSKKQMEIINLESSENLWGKMNSGQKAKILPYGYLSNFIRSCTPRGTPRINVMELFHLCVDDKLVFGIPHE